MHDINKRFCNKEIGLAYEYWQSKAKDSRLPARADIDPMEMRGWIQAVLLAEAVFDADGTPVDFLFRVAGSRVCERYGHELTRRHLSDVRLDHQNANILANYAAAIETRRPIFSIARFQDETGLLRSFEMLLLPLCTDGDVCDLLLGVVMPLPPDYDADEGVWIYEAGPADH
ncbi:MAG: PAS domain-containing protein [Rhodovibrio sp.]|nr:PAS domain-containing protein [Rhodovibrio sp.]